MFGQPVSRANTIFFFFRNRAGENRVASLINDIDLFGRNTVKLNYIPLGTFTHRYNTIGLTTGIIEFSVINDSIQTVIILRITKKYQIVNRHYATNSRAMNPHGQLVTQSMIKLYTVLQQPSLNKKGSPQSPETFHNGRTRQYGRDIFMF